MAHLDKHLDSATIRELRSIMGEDFPLLVQTFEADSRQRLAALEAAAAAGNAEALRQAAHSFKGSAGNLGAASLAALCQQLESMGKEGDLRDAAGRIGRDLVRSRGTVLGGFRVAQHPRAAGAVVPGQAFAVEQRPPETGAGQQQRHGADRVAFPQRRP